MNVKHILFEGSNLNTLKHAQRIADRYCSGLLVTMDVPTPAGKEYHTVLRSSDGYYYVTNRFDPRVVQWCKKNNVVPEDR